MEAERLGDEEICVAVPWLAAGRRLRRAAARAGSRSGRAWAMRPPPLAAGRMKRKRRGVGAWCRGAGLFFSEKSGMSYDRERRTKRREKQTQNGMLDEQTK